MLPGSGSLASRPSPGKDGDGIDYQSLRPKPMPAPSELLPRDPVSQGPFAYKPLSRDVDSIRLLTLQPSDQEPAKGKTNPEVRCKLSHVTFAEKPQYQALSYTWGDPHHLKEIILDGVRVKVRENLFWALFHLRSSTPIFLWADAICIDQSNPEERSYQVRLMDYIYSRASCVLVWLGKTSAVTRVRNREFFQELISHPYWSRLWVIQEIALSMKLQVRVESYSFTWTEFLLEIKRSIPEGRRWMVEERMLKERMPITRLDDLRRDRNGPNNRLEVLMEAFQDAQCADPRDKIFGFLGLAHDCQDGTIEADYTKPLFHLYADVIAFFSRSGKFPNAASNYPYNSMRVVHFSQLVQKLLGGGIFYNIAEFPDTAQAPFESQIVKARGKITGTVLHIGPSYAEMVSSSIANRKWRAFFNKFYSSSYVQKLREANESYAPVLLAMTDQQVSRICAIHSNDMYSRVLISKDPWNGDEKTWERDSVVVRDEFRRHGGADDRPSSDVKPILVGPPHIFLGDNCMMGLAPFGAAPGDKICQFWKSDGVALVREDATSGINRIIGRLHLSMGYLEDLEPKYRQAGELNMAGEAVMVDLEIRALALLTC